MDYSKLSSLFSVDRKEVLKGAISAVVASVVVGLASIVSQQGFDVFAVEWSPVLHSMLNWAFAGFVGSLGRNFGTTSDGKFLGVVNVK